MGTVRREGDWRLEKRREGVYEITFRKEPQMRVLTSNVSERGGPQQLLNALPVRRVSSFSEAEGLFEERAHGPPPVGMETPPLEDPSDLDLSEADFGADIDVSETPPGIFGIAILIAGSFILYSFWGVGNQIALLLGIGFVGVGVVILAYGGYLFKSEGWREAWEFLVTATSESDGGTTSSGGSNTEKTPPAPESLKNELFFERADRHCEYCGDEIDHPEVHHITPRSEGGQNTPRNLIVLCPNCHRKADRGSISKSKLKYRINGS